MVDTLLSSALQAAKASGIEIEESDLKKRDSRLLAREVAMAVAEHFEQITAETGESSPEHLAFANGLLSYLAANAPSQAVPGLQLTTRVLRRVGQSPNLQPTDLSEHGLLTGRETGENLLLHLRRELATCDRADWLVSFIKLRGVCQLQGDIEAFLRRGGELRVATTAYMGATEPRALDALHDNTAAGCGSSSQRQQIRQGCTPSLTYTIVTLDLVRHTSVRPTFPDPHSLMDLNGLFVYPSPRLRDYGQR
jgi:hypothetical protein